MIFRRFSLLTAVLYVLLAAVPSQGEYILTLESNAPAQLFPGGEFTVDVFLASPVGDVCDSVVFNLEFSAPGLLYKDYAWGGVFAGSPWDNSKPQPSVPPVAITAGSYNDPMSPGAIDLHFENFTMEPFGQGKLLSVFLSVPTDWQAPAQEITVRVVPDTITTPDLVSYPDGYVPARAGPPLVLNVVPEPSSLFLAVSGGVMAAGWILRRGCRCRRRPA